MKNLTTEFKVGLFTFLALVTVIYMFFVLSPDIISPEDSKEYFTVVDNASGIVTKTHVRTNGVSVGKVEDIKLESSHTKIIFSVSHDVKIPVGSSMEIRTRGLLGETFLEIIRLPDEGKYIEQGSLIPLNSDKVGFTQLIGIMGNIAKDIKKVTNTLADVIGGDSGKSSFKNILSNLDFASKNLAQILKNNRNGVSDIIENLEAFSSNMAAVIDEENAERLDIILSKFESVMEDVRSSANNVKLVSTKIEEGQGTLGQLVNSDDTIQELKAAIADVRSVIAPAVKLKVDVQYQGEFRDDNSNQHFFNMVFRTRPDKFYLLGVTNTKIDEKNTTLVTTNKIESGETTTETSERTVAKAAVKINFQFGKRWGFLALRFGLFETTGGFAGDFYLFNDKLQFTVEAYDWDSESLIRRVAYVKTYSKILFTENIFAIIGVDDLTRMTSSDGIASAKYRFFAGMGLQFNDDDLKSVLGTAALAL